jgi:hypothetical protein
MAANGKITLAIVATELKNLTEEVKGLRVDFKEHIKDDTAIAIIVDRLNTAEQNRSKQLFAIWSALATGFVAFVINLFRTQ